jgi:two-component system, LytTR family, response regulator
VRCLIIDDEAPARSRLTRMLKAHPAVEIAGEASNGLEAIERIEQTRPDAIFLDIQMPGLDGFGILRSLPQSLPKPLVVFVTGFDQHALEAFEANALAYLLKPVEAEQLAVVIERAERLSDREPERGAEDRRLAEAARAIAPKLTQVVGRKRDRLVLLAPVDIVFFSAEDGLIKARTATDTYLVNHQLAELDGSLPEADFFRARRQVLVNLRAVKEIRPYFKSSFLLIMNDAAATEIAVSERQSKLLRRRIPGL